MKKIYKLLSSAKQGLFALALTVFSGTAYSQTTYTLNYTGSVQSLNLPAGSYSIAMWGADGGNGLNGNLGGKGGYSQGTLTIGAPTTYYIYVGGKGATASVPTPGGWNGGGNLVGSFTSGYDCGSGGGGTDIRTTSNTTYANRIIVSGGGGGGTGYSTYTGTGGNGGGANGADGTSSRGQTYAGGGASAVAGGTAATGGIVGYSLAGALGIGGDYAGTLGGAAGGGGYYGGGSGHWGGPGGGGSGYIGGVTGGVSAQASQPGFVTKPIVAGDGLVLITSLCNLNITSTSSLICTGAAVTLSTNAIAGTYTWSTGNTTTTSIVVSPTITTNYTLSGQGTSPNGCSASAAFVVTVNNTPTVTINSSTTSACQGQTVSLTASGANTYTWNNSVTNGVAFAPLATALYTVTGTNACGTATAGVTVSVSALPVTATTTSTLLCAGSAVTLSAAGATTYTWMPGTSTATNYITAPTATTIYTVTGKTGNCQGFTTLTVNTNPLPSMTITAAANAVCFGDPANITVSGNAVSYLWSYNGQTGTSISVTPTLTSIYTVTGTSSANCIRTLAQIIQVYPNPVINITASLPEVCSGGASILTASGANTYSWGPVNTSTIHVNPIVATSYSVTGTNTLTTCHTNTSIIVTIFEPQITVSSNTTICIGSNVVLTAGGANTYTWANNNASVPAILVTPTVNTTYTVSGIVVNLQNGLACPASNTISVNVFALPVITASASPAAICRGTNATVTAEGAGATGTYTWTNGLGNNPVVNVTPVLNQSYVVTAKDDNGCKGTATVQVAVSPCTGINSIAANTANLLVYPNPSNGRFVISADQSITLHIVNELGQLVQTITLDATTPEVKINNLSSGVYFITGKNENGSVKQKIMIAD